MSVAAPPRQKSLNTSHLSDQTKANRPIIELDGLFGRVTIFEDRIWLCGTVFHRGKALSAKELADTLSDAVEQDRLAPTLAQLNGFFSIVFTLGAHTYLISDRLRSRPLFYAQLADAFIVTDNVEKIIGRMPNYEFRESAAREFLATGYVTGSDTLVEGIYQVQAAEVVTLDGEARTGLSYWFFLPHYSDSAGPDIATLLADLDRSMTAATERMIEMAAGRQIVVPLSGGFDSRIIVAYLVKLGYENIVTFTFGDKDSVEVSISKRVAETLNLRWHFVQYEGKLWRDIKRSGVFNRYVRRINSLVSAPNVMVFPALQRLLNDKIIAPDAVVVPGHAGDFTAGNHIPPSMLTDDEQIKALDTEAVLAIIKKNHFSKAIKLFDDAMEAKVRDQLESIISFSGVDNPVALYEAWSTRERQAKFTANSNRYYDFFGLDWWMPLWDNDVVKSLEEAPLHHRIKRRLWVAFVDHQMALISGSSAPLGDASERQKKQAPTGFISKRLHYLKDENHMWALIPYPTRLSSAISMKRKGNVFFGYLAGFTLDLLKRDALATGKSAPPRSEQA